MRKTATMRATASPFLPRGGRVIPRAAPDGSAAHSQRAGGGPGEPIEAAVRSPLRKPREPRRAELRPRSRREEEAIQWKESLTTSNAEIGRKAALPFGLPAAGGRLLCCSSSTI